MTKLVKRSINLDVIQKQPKQKISEKIVSWALSKKFISGMLIALITKAFPAFAEEAFFGVVTRKANLFAAVRAAILLMIPLACVLACFKKLWIFSCILYTLYLYTFTVLILGTIAVSNLTNCMIMFLILLIPVLVLLLTVLRQYRRKKIKKKEFKKKMLILGLTVGLASLVTFITLCWSGYQYYIDEQRWDAENAEWAIDYDF